MNDGNQNPSYKIFISYSHADEWLKDELIKHLSALRRDGRILVWHDRLISAGQDLHAEIDQNLYTSQLLVLLVSSDALASNYCMDVEFKAALNLRQQGKMEIVPVLVRKCDFGIPALSGLNFTPPDAVPVNGPNVSRTQPELRDELWAKVVKDFRVVFDRLDKERGPIALSQEFVARRIHALQFEHARVENADLQDFYCEPEMVYTATEKSVESSSAFADLITEKSVVLLAGDDQSGKTALLYKVQDELCSRGLPAVIISGTEIRNVNVERLIEQAAREQLGDSSFRSGSGLPLRGGPPVLLARRFLGSGVHAATTP